MMTQENSICESLRKSMVNPNIANLDIHNLKVCFCLLGFFIYILRSLFASQGIETP